MAVGLDQAGVGFVASLGPGFGRGRLLSELDVPVDQAFEPEVRRELEVPDGVELSADLRQAGSGLRR